MVTVRRGVFETNSSSVHSIVICTETEYKEWQAGLLTFNPYTEEFNHSDQPDVDELRKDAAKVYDDEHTHEFYRSWDELTDEAKENFIQSYIRRKTPHDSDTKMTYDYYRYYYQEGCEFSSKTFTTEHGDRVVAFGKGGMN